MLGIFKDERRGNGGFSSGPAGVRPKSALAALRTLESAMHFLHARALPGHIWTRTVIHAERVHAAWVILRKG